MTFPYPLRLRGPDHEVTVEVIGRLARLEARPGGAGAADGAPVVVEVPARGLVAALRAAWADEHAGCAFEPWRDDQDGRYGGYGPRGDLGEGDPAAVGDGWPDPEPDPWPAPAPRPARSGEPWTPEEEATARAMWLEAAPDADRAELHRRIAEKIERTPGGVLARLRQMACDPTCPGRALDRARGMPLPDTQPVLRLVPAPSSGPATPGEADA